jgi:uncharacterized glyoxalase superfamily protein PhnB
MKLTPVLFVDQIEKSLPFWMERAGFNKTAEVPDGDRLAFAMLANGAAEVMLQTWESAEKDIPGAFAQTSSMAVALFLEVDDFAVAKKRLGDWPVAMPERVTFYGMREIGVRDPDGHWVTFAAPEPK